MVIARFKERTGLLLRGAEELYYKLNKTFQRLSLSEVTSSSVASR